MQHSHKQSEKRQADAKDAKYVPEKVTRFLRNNRKEVQQPEFGLIYEITTSLLASDNKCYCLHTHPHSLRDNLVTLHLDSRLCWVRCWD